MYNRYIPDDTSYTRVEQEPSAPHRMDQERPAGQNHRPGGPSQGPGNRPQPGHPQPGQQGGYSMGGFKLPSFLNGKDGLSALLGGREGAGCPPCSSLSTWTTSTPETSFCCSSFCTFWWRGTIWNWSSPWVWFSSWVWGRTRKRRRANKTTGSGHRPLPRQ